MYQNGFRSLFSAIRYGTIRYNRQYIRIHFIFCCCRQFLITSVRVHIDFVVHLPSLTLAIDSKKRSEKDNWSGLLLCWRWLLFYSLYLERSLWKINFCVCLSVHSFACFFVCAFSILSSFWIATQLRIESWTFSRALCHSIIEI